MRRGTVELKGVVGPQALLSGRAGANDSVGMATRRLGWPAVVADGSGRLTEDGGTRGPPTHEDTRWSSESLEGDEASDHLHPVGPCKTLAWVGEVLKLNIQLYNLNRINFVYCSFTTKFT